ncbi:MAG: protein kinase [Planctomycetota bacterium]
MSDPSPPLLQAAESIADGRAVDWQDVERATAAGTEREILPALQHVERIASFHREWFDASRASPEAPRERWGHLKILERLGRGSFGEVYRAFDTKLERQVALKLLRIDRAQLGGESRAALFFLQEGRHMARLRHPNVVTVHGADEHDGRVGLWMELVAGKTLAQILEAQGLLSAREAASIGLDLCRALAAVHQAGLLHRDIKPQNVMRESGGRIVLMDFGAGADASGARGSSSPTGTPLYMAPEVLRGEAASPRSDLYAVGVLLYHLVTNSYPVHASELSELVAMHERGAMTRLHDARADLPLDFVSVVEQALARDPRQRFKTAGEMAAALARSTRPRLSWPRRIGIGLIAATVLIATAWLLAPSSYGVQARLCRIVAGQRQPLKSGDRIAVGDRLGVELTSSRELWVYIVNEDEKGNRNVLFPVDGFTNPQPPTREARWLPGYLEDGSEQAWEIDTVGGKEHFLIVVSPQPIEPLMERLAREQQPGEHVARNARGAGGKQPGPPSQPSDPHRLVDAVEALADRAQTVTGIWKLRIDLDNPGD